jgi:hypothetical protein
MLQQRSRFAARHAERPRLAPAWLIALFAATVVLVLVFLYPRRDLERRLTDDPDTALSLAYLDNLLRGEPDNPRLRLLLARHQLKVGELAEAKRTLQAALTAGDPGIRRAARWLQWQTVEAEWKALPAADRARRDELGETLRLGLHELAREEWPLEQKILLGAKAYEHGEYALGSALYRAAAQAAPDGATAAALFETSARRALAAGDYRGSAELNLLARRSTDDPHAARGYFLAAIEALQAGNLPLAALETAEREIDGLDNDTEILYLMVKLARAAGRPDVADRYVRKLLRIALLRQWQRLRIARAWGPGEFLRVTASARTQGPGIPFDDKLYSLGYDVFLENGKLEDAWRVAQSAVRQAPDSVAWRERLARVAEWTGRAEIALENWYKVAQATQKDEAWQAVLRLAPGLFDDVALAAALRHRLARGPQEPHLVQELVAAYERQGKPELALAYLQELGRRQPAAEWLLLEAELAERMGQTELAIASWQRLFADERQLSPSRAMHLAVLLLLQGRGSEGLAWLEKAQGQASLKNKEDADYWRLTGELQEAAGKDAAALQAYRRLVDSEFAQRGDYDALLRLLTDGQPLQAARLAALAWRKYGDRRYLMQAMGLYVAQARWTEFGELLRELKSDTPAQKKRWQALQNSPEFLRMLAAYERHTGHIARASRLLEDALRLAPGSAELAQALIWLHIDANDSLTLRRLLDVHEAEWAKNATLHDALAAAYQALSLPQVALARYLTPRLGEHRNDFLWLMNYADALEQNQQSDRAWRLRRQLLMEEWRKLGLANPDDLAARRQWLRDTGLDSVRRVARARLLLQQNAGDGGLAALRELLRLDRDAERNLSDAAAETAIGWLQERAEYTAERGFLWERYARSRSKPANRLLWAEATLALAEEDRAEGGQLLATYDERLPRYDRVNLARSIDALRYAQSAAFEAQERQENDEPLQLQLSESLLAFSDHAGLAVGARELGGLNERPASVDYHLAIDPKLTLDFSLGQIRRDVTDANLLQRAPDENLLGVGLNIRHDDGETRLRAERRRSFDDYSPFQLERRQRIDDRLSLTASLGHRLPSQESIPLRIAGMKDQAAIALAYRATRLDRLSLEHAWERYRLQSGAALGSGSHTTLSYSHTYRQESRDFEIGAFWSRHRFDRQAIDSAAGGFFDRYVPNAQKADYGSASGLPGNYFVPDSFVFYGIRASTDLRFEREYTRAARPYASLGLTHHSVLGLGYDLRLGLAASVLGADHLALGWGIAKAGTQSGGTIRDLFLTYRLHY